MDPTAIFGLQFVMSLLVFAVIAIWYAAPLARGEAGVDRTDNSDPAARLPAYRIEFPGAQSEQRCFARYLRRPRRLRRSCGGPSRDCMPGGAALAVPSGHTADLGFQPVGFADLLNALRQAEAINHFGATWFIPTFLVPLLLVTHVMIFMRLLKRNHGHENAA